MEQTLMAIGGALDVRGPGAVLREFYARAGGAGARLVVVPTASSNPDAAVQYIAAFRALGLRRPPVVLPITRRGDTQDPDHTTAVRSASGIFFTGGHQVRLSTTFGGTPLARELRKAHARGAVVAGTSAGAAILSAVMVAFSKGGPTPRRGIVQLVPGLGFTDRLIIDQHFRQRDRLGRLLYAVAHHPGALGVGVDEDTAAVLEGDVLTVVGTNAVTVIDGAGLVDTNAAEVDGGGVLAVSGLLIHVLAAGCTFDLRKRRAHIPRNDLKVD